jgi:hypothetical protein
MHFTFFPARTTKWVDRIQTLSGFPVFLNLYWRGKNIVFQV